MKLATTIAFSATVRAERERATGPFSRLTGTTKCEGPEAKNPGETKK